MVDPLLSKVLRPHQREVFNMYCYVQPHSNSQMCVYVNVCMMCVYVCARGYVYIHIHTHTHTSSLKSSTARKLHVITTSYVFNSAEGSPTLTTLAEVHPQVNHWQHIVNGDNGEIYSISDTNRPSVIDSEKFKVIRNNFSNAFGACVQVWVCILPEEYNSW